MPTLNINELAKGLQASLPGMVVTGGVGALIGSFIGGALWIVGMAAVGALLGMVVWRLGGRRFFLCVMIGALAGASLAIFLNGMESALIGGATGGAMGGFVGVNLSMMKPRSRS